ncbi:MAG: amino acid adenylation domain-containing protein [Longimicrobiaceae bacterium]
MSTILPEESAAERRRLLAEILRRRAAEARTFPLSFAQQRLWFLDRMEPGSPAYTVAAPLHLRGPLRAGLLERALDEVVRRHGSLRTTFTTLGEEPVQVVAPPAAFILPLADLASLPAPEREREARRLAAEEADRPFDLAAGPLFRARLLRLGAEDHVLLLAMHHIVTDGWSLGILFREISALYAASLAGAPPPLPALALQYADFAAWQRGGGAAGEDEMEFWREALRGTPPLLELPTDRPRPPVPTHRGASLPLALDAADTARLREVGRAEGATLFMTLMAAFHLFLSRYSGEDDVVVGTPVAGRTRPELEGLVGLFVNTLAIRADVGGDPDFRVLLGRVREALLGAYSHQHLPFDRLVEELQPERSLSHTPVFQVMFAVQGGAGAGGLALEGVESSFAGTGTRTARFDLEVELREEPEGLRGALEYAVDLFDRATAERMAAHFQALLRGIAAAPDSRISEIPLLDGAERRLLLEEWSGTALELPAECVHERFARQAERTPDAPAVLCGADRVSYGELERRSRVLARHLRARGIGPEARVGICMDPSPQLPVAVLGVLRAGAAYVPLDPSHPTERLAWALADTSAALLLTQAHLAAGLAAHGVETLALDAGWEGITREAAELPAAPPHPESLAYLIHTSGSTGTPKAVCVTHRGAAHTLRSAADAFGFGPGDEMPVLASHAFDIWLFEALAPLLAGAAIRMVPRERVVNVDALVEELAGATLLHAVPALMRQLVQQVRATPHGVLPRMRRVFVGGDAVPPSLLREMREAFPAAEPWVLYGPTEATIVCAAHPASVVPEREMVGSPLAGARLYVCDRAGGPAPLGVPGELLVGGAGVGRGYLGRPELTSEKFVPDPFGGAPGARLYRTGDRARWLQGGVLEFLGRTDRQVKVRGFRVEPGETEARLAALPGVRAAAVVPAEDPAGGARLVAYVVVDGNAAAADLRQELRATLPEHMVPAAFVFLEALPLTPTGKVDRRALPPPGAGPERAYEPPKTALEDVLAGVWAEVLRVERVGIRDSFFDLGGHSLLATQLVSRLGMLKLEASIRLLFQAPTVEGMARGMVAAEATPGQTERVAAMVLRIRSLSSEARRQALRTTSAAGGAE